MEKFEILIKQSKNKIKIADHMLTMSYSLVKDPKILLSVTNNIFLSMEYAMTALLEYERLFKRVQVFKDTFNSKYTLFVKLSQKMNIDKEYVKMINELKEIKTAHEKSPVEFSRKGKFVICSDDYEIKTIEIKDLKIFINKAKLFIEQIVKIINIEDGIFR